MEVASEVDHFRLQAPPKELKDAAEDILRAIEHKSIQGFG